MATFNKFNSFVEDLAEKVHNLESDSLKIVLSNVAPSASNTQLSDITQVANGNGYTTGGAAISISSSAQSGGTYKLVGADVVFTATGGSIGPFRYAIIYNDTSTGDRLIGWWDYGSAITLADSDTFTVDLDPSAGILTLA